MSTIAAEVPTIAAHGLDMPVLGFGTWQLPPETIERILPVALEAGYRHIDTAQIYGNERAIGEALQVSGLPRSELFLTTKVWVDHYAPEDFLASVRDSLDRLRMDYVDLLLLHWPVFGGRGMTPTLEALLRVRSLGLARQIGISNFNIEQTAWQRFHPLRIPITAAPTSRSSTSP